MSAMARQSRARASALRRCGNGGRGCRARPLCNAASHGPTEQSTGMVAGLARARPKGTEMSTTSADEKTHLGRVRLELGAKLVRPFLGGEAVADTARPVLVWEVPYYPTYY